MEIGIDEYRLEGIARDHPIGTAMFVPFAIARLRGDTDATEATLTVRLRGRRWICHAQRYFFFQPI